ncbi:MAG: transglutaminase-like domain-containing protein [Methanoregula sp.]|nr:transglutaminase-like domain-containing protein [Methanoregula sp.]
MTVNISQSYNNESIENPASITTPVPSSQPNAPERSANPVSTIIANTQTDAITYSKPTPQIIDSDALSDEHLILRNYSWKYKGIQWNWSGSFSKAGFDYYRSRPHNRENNYAAYALSDYDRQLTKDIVQIFKEAGEEKKFTDYDTIMNIVSFVQSLNYTSDKVTTGYDEYPRYPVETLIDNGGDCEDTAILTAALLHELGFGVVLIQLPEHMAVGVKGSDTLQGTYYDYQGSRYYYLETAGSGWKIGEFPEEYKTESARILPLVQLPRMDLNCKTNVTDFDRTSVYYRTRCDIENIGVGTAKNPRLYIAALALDQGADLIWKPDSNIRLDDYAEGTKGYAEASLKIPRNKMSQIKCVLSGDNFESLTALSATFTS